MTFGGPAPYTSMSKNGNQPLQHDTMSLSRAMEQYSVGIITPHACAMGKVIGPGVVAYIMHMYFVIIVHKNCQILRTPVQCQEPLYSGHPWDSLKCPN